MLALAVAGVGFYIVYKQLNKLNVALQSEAQSELYSQSGVVRKLIVQYPELRKYFFNEGKDGIKIQKENNEDEYARVRTLAELYLNYFEHFVIQSQNLREKDWNAWKNTLLDIYDGSPIIQDVFLNKPQWYCKDLHKLLSGPRE